MTVLSFRNLDSGKNEGIVSSKTELKLIGNNTNQEKYMSNKNIYIYINWYNLYI